MTIKKNADGFATRDSNSRNNSQIDANQLVEKFQKIVDSRFARYIINNIASNDRFEKILEMYSGIAKPKNTREKMQLKVVSAAIRRSLGMFSSSEEQVKKLLEESHVRKAVSLTLRSVAEYGLTRPQIFSAPFLVVWNITKKCNLKCEHCYASAGLKNPLELSLEEKLRLVDGLSHLGTFMISFAGGEPLMSEDFWEVAKFASERGMYTSIATNGTLLTKYNVRRLKNIGIKYIEISLDSSSLEIHDKFRGVKGTFEKTVRGIKNVIEDGSFETGMATVATKYNLNDVADTMELARDLGIGRFIVFNFVPTGRGVDIIKQDLTPGERESLLHMLYDRWQSLSDSGEKMGVFSTSPTYSRIGIEEVMKGEGKIFSPTHFAGSGISNSGVAIADFIGGCGAGRMYAGIEDNGDVAPCVFLPIKVGNVRDRPFSEIWKDSPILNALRDRSNLSGYCSECAFKSNCGGCRARAYGYYGDINGPDPGCIYNQDYYDQLIVSADFKKGRIRSGTSAENSRIELSLGGK